MKTHSILALILSLLLAAARPMLAQTSGQISYEVVRKVDPAGIRIIINGEQVKPGDPNFPTDIPDTRTFGQNALFANNYVKESRDGRPGITIQAMGPGGGGGVPRTTNFSPPFEEKTFVDLTNQKTVTLLTVGKDKDAKAYRAEAPIQRATDWQLTDQTKKIAGYTCRKATVPFKKETYTVWFTTELPITYSPIRELTPEAGVVLLVESSREQFRATKVNLSAISAKDVQPSTEAQTVTPEQLNDLRQKAMADFQQQMMMGERP
ncbi:GLPGLI family protein [Spirosoma sp. HMF4905]|uniref:GLPGLI family protein n=1 Tax=Spirosoma arboris TaxID=2682092 RepID=A0A7K1S6N9_9BACT|nr:GLPGLI family protein [Spirosoma arboris]MVM29483.1 GLPGLI family protein [Spirosoma arboris]